MQQRTYTDFSGGQNTNSGANASPIVVDFGQTEALRFAESSGNWRHNEDGLLQYEGDIALIESPDPAVVTGEKDWQGYTILCKGTKIYTVSGDVETEIYPSGGTPQTAGAPYQFTECDDGAGNELLLIMNGVDPVLEFNGSTCVRMTVIDDDAVIWGDARPQGAMYFRGSLFYWGDSTHPHRWWKPRPGTRNNFDNTDKTVESGDVDAGFGGKLTGMHSLTDDMAVIFKERAIRRMSGVNPFNASVDPITIRPISDTLGCVAPRTIVQEGLDLYFLSEDGLRQLKPVLSYGDLDPEQPTYAIQNVINDLNFTSTAIVNACATFHKPTNLLWLSVPEGSSATNNLIIIHHTITGAVDLRGIGDIQASTITVVDRKIHTGGYDGQVYKHGDDYTYNGGAIAAAWESKWVAHDGIGRRKIYRQLHIYCESDGAGELIIQYMVQNHSETMTQSTTEEISTGDDAWDEAVFDISSFGDGNQQIFKIKNLGKGNAIKLRFVNNAPNQNVKIRTVDLFYDLLNTSHG